MNEIAGWMDLKKRNSDITNHTFIECFICDLYQFDLINQYTYPEFSMVEIN